VHEKAIYLHGGEQYHVEHLILERKAYVKKVEVDYYTDAVRYTQVRVLKWPAKHERLGGVRKLRFALAVGWDALVRFAGGGIQENKVLRMKNRRGKVGVAGKRDAHDFVLADARACVGGVATFFDQRATERNVWAVVCDEVGGDIVADVRRTRFGDRDWRAAAKAGSGR
jgi:ATP-dependent helicase YprA (DUF1998 family)